MDSELLVGQTLDGKYRIDQPLGVGGMGAVFRATHLGTERLVALKVISPRLMNDAQSLERFKREARAAGRLQHPNVVNVTDFGIASLDTQHVAYLAMEYLEGFTLGELLRRQGKLPAILTADILEQVAIAVDEAHRVGIVHRDLKPENIWLRPDRRGGYQVKVLDFGVATFRESVVTESDHAATLSSDGSLSAVATDVAAPQLTRVGAMVGTPAYMSPEQCSGRRATAASDVYSLGVIAFQMLTGELPYCGNTAELIAKHIAAPPPELPGVKKRIAEVVRTALAKSPEQRPISATAFAGALRARSEGTTMVLRRAIAIFAMHADQFAGLVCAAHVPLLAWTAVLIPLMLIYGLRVMPLLVIAAGLMLVGEISAGALISVAVDHFRQHPLEPISMREVVRRLGQKSGAQRELTPARLFVHSFRLMAMSLRATRRLLRQRGAAATITLLALFDNETGPERLSTTNQELARHSLWPLRILESMVAAFNLLVFAVLLLAIYVGLALDVTPQTAAVMARAGMLICTGLMLLMALLLNPLTSIADAIFYFRARQALGDNATFSIEPRL